MEHLKKSFQDTPESIIDESDLYEETKSPKRHESESGSVYNIHDIRIELSEESKEPKRKRSRSVSDSSMLNVDSIQVDMLNDKHGEYLIINYEKDHLSDIPGNKLIKLIKDTYPEHIGPQRKLTISGLKDVLKMGAKVNYLDCLNEDIITELAHILDLPLTLSDKYIDSISALVNVLSSDHRTKYSNANSKFKNRRQALVINPQARILHKDQNLEAVGHTESFKKPSSESESKKRSCLCWLKTKNKYTTFYLIFLIISFV